MELLILIALIVWALSSGGKRMAKRTAGTEQPNPRFPAAGVPAGTGPIGRAGSHPRAHPRARPVRAPAPSLKDTYTPMRPSMTTHGEGVGHEGLWAREAPRVTLPAPAWNAAEGPARQPAPAAAPVGVPGLNLSFDADALVQGVLYAEILARKGVGRRR